MTAKTSLTTLICMLCLLAPMTASADIGDKLFVGAMTGSGGEFEGEWDSSAQLGPFDFTSGGSVDEDMARTWGGFLHYDSPVHPNFALGSRLSVASFQTQTNQDEGWSPNWAFNVDFAPRLNIGVPELPIEVYATTPIGLSVLLPSNDWDDQANLDLDVGLSWNLSVLAGINFMFTDDLGIFVEGGWMLQNINWEGQNNDGNADVALEGDFSQTAVNAGFVLAM